MTEKVPGHYKFVLSGYYGHGNYGDEEILSIILSEIEKNFENPDITIISNQPKNYSYKSIHKYNLFDIWREIKDCDVLISGGGSLLQDKTSFRSLLYYLAVLHMAQRLGKKTFVFAQGMGEFKSMFSESLTAKVLKKVDSVTVRDEDSAEVLSYMDIKATVTADPVWMKDISPRTTEPDRLKIGVQLRKWGRFKTKRLNTVADAVIANFNDKKCELDLISLQPGDKKIMENFRKTLVKKGFEQEIKCMYDLSNDEITDCISELDVLIAMRYHAGLVAAKACIPSVLLVYDPKVNTLAKETLSPFIAINELDFYRLDKAIKHLLTEKDSIKQNLREVSAQKSTTASNTITQLKNLLN